MRARYRIGTEGAVFKKHVIVLQVFKWIPEGEGDSHGGAGSPAHAAWVDAALEDLTENEIVELGILGIERSKHAE